MFRKRIFRLEYHNVYPTIFISKGFSKDSLQKLLRNPQDKIEKVAKSEIEIVCNDCITQNRLVRHTDRF